MTVKSIKDCHGFVKKNLQNRGPNSQNNGYKVLSLKLLAIGLRWQTGLAAEYGGVTAIPEELWTDGNF